jgi:hypothetical protein
MVLKQFNQVVFFNDDEMIQFCVSTQRSYEAPFGALLVKNTFLIEEKSMKKILIKSYNIKFKTLIIFSKFISFNLTYA